MKDVIRRIKRYVRSAINAQKCRPVRVVAGNSPPLLVGDAPRYVTPKAETVRFPIAYRRRFGRPIYIASTLRVEVGEGWVRQALIFGLDCPPEVVTDFVSGDE